MTNDAALAPLIESYLDLRWHFDPVPATPAYPLCYAVGRREIKDLRDDFRAAAGGEYSLRAFHDAVLSYGGLPVGLMRWGMGLRRS